MRNLKSRKNCSVALVSHSPPTLNVFHPSQAKQAILWDHPSLSTAETSHLFVPVAVFPESRLASHVSKWARSPSLIWTYGNFYNETSVRRDLGQVIAIWQNISQLESSYIESAHVAQTALKKFHVNWKNHKLTFRFFVPFSPQKQQTVSAVRLHQTGMEHVFRVRELSVKLYRFNWRIMSSLRRFYFFKGAVCKQLGFNYEGTYRDVHWKFEQKHCGMEHVVNWKATSSPLGSVNTAFFLV